MRCVLLVTLAVLPALMVLNPVIASPLSPDWLTDVCRQQLEADGPQGAEAQQQLERAASEVSARLNIRQSDVLMACKTAAAAAATHGVPAQQQSQQQAQRQLLQKSSPPPPPPAPPRPPRPPRAFPRPPRPPRPPAPPPPNPPPPPPPPPKADPVQPRLDIDVISRLPTDNLYRIMFLMAADEFMNRGPVTGDDSYHGVAGIHGAFSNYNGQSPGGTGFCRHEQDAFGPWHRPYVLLYERYLQSNCKTVARRFQDEERRSQALYVCDLLRAPFWDYSTGSTPSLLTSSTVTVYDSTGRNLVSISNPIAGFCYRTSASTNQGNRGPGDCVRRDFGWSGAVSSSSWTLRNQISAFLSSGSWSCTNLGRGNGCSGNLELIHNNIHNTVGGDMSTLALAGWDPLFWLHHCNVDRLLFLYQANTGQYLGSSIYTPFPSSVDCGSNIGSCGYSYGASRPNFPTSTSDSTSDSTGQVTSGSVRSGASNPILGRRLFGEDDTSGGDPSSPQARAYLQKYIAQLTGGYQGYSWNVVVSRLNPYLLKDRLYAVHVMIGNSTGELPMRNGDEIDVNALRMRSNYCGSNAGFRTFMPEMVQNKTTTMAVSINHCLSRSGIDPNTRPRNPADLTEGPDSRPVSRDMLKLMCIDSNNKDCTSLIEGSYSVSLGWTVLAKTYHPEAQTFGHDDVRTVSTVNAQAPAGVPGPDGTSRFLYAEVVRL